MKCDFQYSLVLFISCIEEAKKLYPGRVSVDLIFGRPGQTLDGWKQELKQVRTNLFELYYCWLYLLDFFCSGIQFNLLLSPYPCFISLLYLDLYVLGDDALIS